MTEFVRRTWMARFRAVLIAVLCFGAAISVSKSADARVWLGFTVGAPAWSYYAPAYYPYYYPYYRPHIRYWRWRHRHWCYWHPYRCG